MRTPTIETELSTQIITSSSGLIGSSAFVAVALGSVMAVGSD
jgi:hypothetical protein